MRTLRLFVSAGMLNGRCKDMKISAKYFSATENRKHPLH